MALLDVPTQMWHVDLRSLTSFREWVQRDSAALQFRRELQRKLEAGLPAGSEATYLGYCAVCEAHQRFVYDYLYSDGKSVNWRERLVCRGCHLNNRLRLAWQTAGSIVDFARDPMYLTEHLTPFADRLRSRAPGLLCSEYLGESVELGRRNGQGIRHEDLTRLTFGSAGFRAVLSFDVFEHIPDYRAALGEVARVLAPGGTFLMTVPLHLGSEPNIIRAEIDALGRVQHNLPPEYHGDPVDPDKGILCFYHFGWALLADLKTAGFRDAMIRLLWSSDFANIGDEQPIVIGLK
jgi:SAM-dependent methyltransferase